MYPGAISFIVYRPASGALDPGDRNTALGRPGNRPALEAVNAIARVSGTSAVPVNDKALLPGT